MRCTQACKQSYAKVLEVVSVQRLGTKHQIRRQNQEQTSGISESKVMKLQHSERGALFLAGLYAAGATAKYAAATLIAVHENRRCRRSSAGAAIPHGLAPDRQASSVM